MHPTKKFDILKSMEHEILLSHLEDLARRTQKTGAAYSRFLTPAEIAATERIFQNRQDVTLLLDGGFKGAERQMAVFLQPDWGSFEREEAMAALRLTYRKQDALSHRDILGALMALGIKRELLGDIEAGNPGFLICTAQIAPYLLQNLDKAGRVGLKLSQIDFNELPARGVELEEWKDTVASLRLDAMAAAAFRLSRSEAMRAIEAGLVQVNHAEVLSGVKLLKEGDLLSMRGKGRVRLLETGGESRKGRTWVSFGRYV